MASTTAEVCDRGTAIHKFEDPSLRMEMLEGKLDGMDCIYEDVL